MQFILHGRSNDGLRSITVTPDHSPSIPVSTGPFQLLFERSRSFSGRHKRPADMTAKTKELLAATFSPKVKVRSNHEVEVKMLSEDGSFGTHRLRRPPWGVPRSFESALEGVSMLPQARSQAVRDSYLQQGAARSNFVDADSVAQCSWELSETAPPRTSHEILPNDLAERARHTAAKCALYRDRCAPSTSQTALGVPRGGKQSWNAP